MDAITSSSLHIAISGDVSIIDEKSMNHIQFVFGDIFADQADKVSDTILDEYREVIYEVQVPIIKDETLIKEFFEDLEVLLEELKGFNPHFTQFKRGDIK